MERIIIRLWVLVVSIMVIMGSTVVCGSIIPIAQQAKDNAVAPDFSPVIEIIEEDWILTPSPQNAGGTTILAEDGKILLLSEQGKEHGVAPAHSPVIDIVEEDWVLTTLSNSGGHSDEVLNMPLELNREVTEVFSTALMQEQAALPVTGMSQDSSFAVVPEPATLLLLSLGVVILKKKH